MLSKPEFGWSSFRLEGTSEYGLSYMDDIAFEWLDHAIHGLKTMQPFCVKGFLEPNRFLCTVSYWNCHIIIEDDDRDLLKRENIIIEYSHTSMLDFCKYLYADINDNIDAWADFINYGDEDYPHKQKKKVLEDKLNQLKVLLISREACFGAGKGFW